MLRIWKLWRKSAEILDDGAMSGVTFPKMEMKVAYMFVAEGDLNRFNQPFPSAFLMGQDVEVIPVFLLEASIAPQRLISPRGASSSVRSNGGRSWNTRWRLF